jgi:hypothetical protein
MGQSPLAFEAVSGGAARAGATRRAATREERTIKSASFHRSRGAFQQLAECVHHEKSIGMDWQEMPKWSDTPKMSGPHRRCGRPFGELSPLHSGLAVGLVLVVFGLFVMLVYFMSR